jgi:2-methylfumaryl-CoA isomerase
MTDIVKGLRLVEVSAFIAAPYAGLTLAQMGADVIRIDPVGGGLDYRRWPVTSDNASLYWAGLNKGKRSIMLNVREDEGRELAHALMTKPGPETGIVLTNLPARGWLDYDGLKAKRNDLIMLGITGNRDGSIALDYTVNAAAGFPLVTGPENHTAPVNHVMPVWDVVAGLSAVNGILTAERQRRETGKGQYIGLALADTAFSTLSHLGYVGEVQINGDDRPATGNQVYGTFGCDFATADGRRVMITAFTPRHWQALLKATETEARMKQVEELFELDLKLEEARWEARDTIIAVLKSWFTSHTLADARKALDNAGACWGPYQTFSQAVHEDERISTSNPMFEEIDQPGIGRYLAAGSMLDFGGAPRTPVMPAPVLGGSTDEILAGELGLGEGQIGKLHDAGIVAGAMS